MSEILVMGRVLKDPEPAPPLQTPKMLRMTEVRGRVTQAPKKRTPSEVLTLADLNNRRIPQVRISKQRAKAAESVPSLTPTPLWSVLKRGAWSGQRAFIIGGGPSLKGFNWDLLRGELTIGINRAFEKFDPSMMFCMDTRLWGWIVRGDFGREAVRRYEEFTGMRVWIDNPSFIFPDDINVVGMGELSPCGSNSGHAAVKLAMLLGANPIYLLGFDMRGNGKGGQKWWHDGYADKQPEGVYATFIKALTEDAPAIKATGTTVVNLTPRSALKCFPHATASSVLRKKTGKPIVVSFYTEGTGYKAEADNLIKSVRRFGFEYDIVPRPDMGGWKKNTYYKAEFILEMMDAHPGRNLLWIDADGAMIQYPVLFDSAEEDIGVFIADWKKIGGYKRRLGHKELVQDTEVLSGTIYVAGNPRSRAFISAWVELNKKRFDSVPMEQVNLQSLLGFGRTQAERKYKWKGAISVKHLPPSYCQIWDTMAFLGDPVIEHYQASRRLRGANT